MKPGIYKHVNNTEVAMKVTRSYRCEGGYDVTCYWLSLPKGTDLLCEKGSDRPFQDSCFITDDQLPNWKEYDVTV